MQYTKLMHQTINEKVDVITVYTRSLGGVSPKRIRWQGKEYDVSEIGMHHPVRKGRVLHHIFSVVAGSLYFRLDFDTENLQWHLEEISDGLAD